jgi:DNA-binding MarR family transcriptional regulator
VINRLTEKELLYRKLNNNDLHSFEIELTEKGNAAVTEHLAAEVVIFEQMLNCLDDNEKETFVKLFHRIVSHITSDV